MSQNFREGASAAVPSLAVAGDEFGWGSVGELAAVLDVLADRPDPPVLIGLDTWIGRPVLERHAVGTWLDASAMDDETLRRALAERDVHVALVVLNADLAVRLESIGCAVVYVDTIPFMWTEHELVPTGATRYCAQLCPALPRPCWPVLRDVESLRWIGGIVGGTPHRVADPRPVPGKAVINFGGLVSPISTDDSVDSYLDLVLNPVLAAFRAAGFTEITIAGNVVLGDLPIAPGVADGLTISGGRMPREVFLAELATAEVIATSPGRTALLEIGMLDQRAMVLPPQNVSQALTAQDVVQVVDPDVVIPWPTDIVDVPTVVRERVHGEDAAVQMMYDRISAARADRPDGVRRLAADCVATLEYVRTHRTSVHHLTAVAGTDGASDVVRVLDEVVASRATLVP